MKHLPVMVQEVLQHLLHERSMLVCDATVGCGGHAQAILDASKTVRLIGIDRDPDALEEAETTLRAYGDRVRLIHGNFAEIGRLLSSQSVDGILADLGLSSLQLDRPDRGFSHAAEGPLAMQMSREGRSAGDEIAGASIADLAGILRKYGEVSGAMRIARSIRQAADEGSMHTTSDLKNAVGRALGGKGGTAPPALLSKVFQAIRMAVNGEMDNLDSFLNGTVRSMKAGGTVVVISYHSLEDRTVKKFLKHESSDCVCPPSVPSCVCGHRASLEPIIRRVVRPGADEIAHNPRARSARLRAARKLEPVSS